MHWKSQSKFEEQLWCMNALRYWLSWEPLMLECSQMLIELGTVSGSSIVYCGFLVLFFSLIILLISARSSRNLKHNIITYIITVYIMYCVVRSHNIKAFENLKLQLFRNKLILIHFKMKYMYILIHVHICNVFIINYVCGKGQNNYVCWWAGGYLSTSFHPWNRLAMSFPHATNLQHTTLKTFSQEYGNSFNERIII